MKAKYDTRILLTRILINIVIIIFIVVLFGMNTFDEKMVVALLIGQSYALLSFDSHRYRYTIYSILFFVATFFLPQCALFVGLSFIYSRHIKSTVLIVLLTLGNAILNLQIAHSWLVILLMSIITWIFNYLLEHYEHYKNLYQKQRDEVHETKHIYKNREVELNQLIDDKLRNTVLEERNRIAGELHDHIGHTISSAIVQAEAYKAIYLDDQKTEEKTAQLSAVSRMIDTLKEGMIDIRTSLHHLRNTSLDLAYALKAMCDRFPNLEVSLYLNETEKMPYDMKEKMIRVVSEVLANTVKHSSANQLKISMVKQRGFYSVTAKDNGKEEVDVDKIGMGLQNMKAIANSFNGTFNYGYQDGFYIHMTLYLNEE